MTIARATAFALAMLPCACGHSEARDAVVESHDVTRSADAGEGTYVYIARRRLGVVALAQTRGVAVEEASRMTDRLADTLEGCLTEASARAATPSGAARIVVAVDDGGVVGAPNLVLSPGPESQALALRCLVVPLRLLRLAPASTDRALAFEASWGAS